MYIKKLSVTNFGGIASFETPLYPGVNIIVGETGAGKTSVLKAAATVLSPIIQAATGELFQGRPIEPWEVRHSTEIRAECPKRRYAFPSVCSAEVVSGKRDEALRVIKTSSSAAVSSWVNGQTLVVKKKRSVKGPLIAFYDEDCGDAFVKRHSDGKYTGYTFWHQAALWEKDTYDWLLNEVVDRVGREGADRDRTDGLQCLEELLERALPAGFESMEINDKRRCVLVRRQDRLQFLNEMNRGDRFVIRYAADLVQRIEWLSHSLTPDFDKTEGVVIIDDADQWLSQRRLWMLVKGLSATFPNVQFIVSVKTALPELADAAGDVHQIILKGQTDTVAEIR